MLLRFVLILFIPLISLGQDQNINLKFSSEQEIREHFDNNIPEGIEGVWQSSGGTAYKLLIVKNGFNYFATIIDNKVGKWRKGDLKAILELLEALTKVIEMEHDFQLPKIVLIIKSSILFLFFLQFGGGGVDVYGWLGVKIPSN